MPQLTRERLCAALVEWGSRGFLAKQARPERSLVCWCDGRRLKPLCELVERLNQDADQDVGELVTLKGLEVNDGDLPSIYGHFFCCFSEESRFPRSAASEDERGRARGGPGEGAR